MSIHNPTYGHMTIHNPTYGHMTLHYPHMTPRYDHMIPTCGYMAPHDPYLCWHTVGLLEQWLIEGNYTEEEAQMLSVDMLAAGIDTVSRFSLWCEYMGICTFSSASNTQYMNLYVKFFLDIQHINFLAAWSGQESWPAGQAAQRSHIHPWSWQICNIWRCSKDATGQRLCQRDPQVEHGEKFSRSSLWYPSYSVNTLVSGTSMYETNA